MVVVPFSSGVVSALLFLAFEIIVFPLLFYSTSILASLFLYRNARKGNDVVIDKMKFPLWSEGLSRHQTSHYSLLAIRIVLIAIPVYLETTLESREEPEMVSRTVTHAFVPQPTDDWYTYQIRSGEHIDSLRRTGLNTFLACTSVDEKGWVWAKVANFTYIQEHDAHQIRCVSNTEQPIYSLTEATVKYGPGNVQLLKMSVSWTEGRVADFPQALVLKDRFGREAPPGETAFRVHNAVALNDTAVKCYFPQTVRTRFSKSRNGHPHTAWRGWCQKEEPIGVAFYSLLVNMDQLPMHNLSYETRERGRCGSSCKLRSRNATTVLEIVYRGSFQFKDKVLLGAKHLANYIPDYDSSLRASDIAQCILYSKASNVTVLTLSGRTLPRTEIEGRAIIIAISEIVVVLLFALMLSCARLSKWGHIQQPNTVSGLSNCWAESQKALSHQRTKEGKWIKLRLRRTGSEGEGPLRFTTSETMRNEQKLENVRAFEEF